MRFWWPERGLLQLYVVLFWFALSLSETTWAEGYYLKFGPASIGNGGPNPLGIPPNPSDIEFSIVTKAGFESSLGVPGLLFGYRYRQNWGGYVSAGGGFILDAHGVGPGGYTAFGYDSSGKTWRFVAEFKQAIGIHTEGYMAPYAVRIGVAYIRD